MSDGPNTPGIPPHVPATPQDREPPSVNAAVGTGVNTDAQPGVSRAALIWMGVAVVVLSFVASFLGATLARTVDANETRVSGVPGPRIALGIGEPGDTSCVTDGDVYIDTEVVEFYECQGGEWVSFGPTASQFPAPTPLPSQPTPLPSRLPVPAPTPSPTHVKG